MSKNNYHVSKMQHFLLNNPVTKTNPIDENETLPFITRGLLENFQHLWNVTQLVFGCVQFIMIKSKPLNSWLTSTSLKKFPQQRLRIIFS